MYEQWFPGLKVKKMKCFRIPVEVALPMMISPW